MVIVFCTDLNKIGLNSFERFLGFVFQVCFFNKDFSLAAVKRFLGSAVGEGLAAPRATLL